MSDVITGEAVALELRVARLPSRAIAFGIDLAIMFAVLLGVALATGGAVASLDRALQAAIGILVLVLVFVVYPVTIETITGGRSVGKIAMGLRVVRTDGGPVRFRHSLTRGLAGLIVDFGVASLLTGAVAVFSSLLSARAQRIGDLLAGTVVLRERTPARTTSPPPMPPELAGWAATLELSRVGDGLALTVRQFLARVDELDATVRVRMAASLVAELSARVSPAPPADTPAEAYLAAVLAERRRREEVRLTGPPPPPQAPPGTPADRPRGDGFATPR